MNPSIRSRTGRQRIRNEDILEAAEELFARQGYGETSLRELIAASGISSTAFYVRYRSKEAVLAAIVSRVLTELLALGSAIFAESSSLEEMFERVPAAIREAVKGHKTALRLALTEALASPAVRPALYRAYAALANLIATYLDRLRQRERLVAGADPRHLGWAMVGAVQVQIMRWAVFEELDDDRLLDALRWAVRLPWSSRPGTRGTS